MKKFVFILTLIWCAPAWADCIDMSGGAKCYYSKDMKFLSNDRYEVKNYDLYQEQKAHNCSLLTVAHNGTVSVVHGLTGAEARKIAKDLKQRYTCWPPEVARGSDAQCNPNNTEIERTEVFCD